MHRIARVKRCTILPGSRGLGWDGGLGVKVAQTMYTHVSKCKNDKIKGERRKESCTMYTMCLECTLAHCCIVMNLVNETGIEASLLGLDRSGFSFPALKLIMNKAISLYESQWLKITISSLCL
jgi:hypothetical protein